MASVLGISVGSRTIGIVVLSKGSLLDCRILTFRDRWSEDKLRAILDAIQQRITKYAITTVGLKAPHPALCSDNILRIVEGIQTLCGLQHMEFVQCTLRDLKQQYTADNRTNKGILISALAFKYPELLSIYTKEMSNKNWYYDKLFEAIECAEHAIEETGL